MVGGFVGRQEGDRSAGADAEHGEPTRTSEVLRLLGAVGGEHAGRDDGVRGVERRRWSEALAVPGDRLQRATEVEVVGEGEAEPELPGHSRQ